MAIALTVVSTSLFFSVAVNVMLIGAIQGAMTAENKLRKEIEELKETIN